MWPHVRADAAADCSHVGRTSLSGLCVGEAALVVFKAVTACELRGWRRAKLSPLPDVWVPEMRATVVP